MEQIKMKAWRVLKFGIENSVISDSEPLPTITDDYQVIIKVIAVGLNPVDYKWAERQNVNYPYTPGIDGCGTIYKLGPKADSSLLEEGKTLVYFHGSLQNPDGYFAEYAVHDSRYLSVIPSELYKDKDLTEFACHLAAMPCAGFTAYQAVCDRLRLSLYKQEKTSNFKSVKSIVVTAGAGGVGGFCLQLLNIWKSTLSQEVQDQVKIISTCSENNIEYVKSLGATHTIDYNKEDVGKRVMEITNNEGVDAWIDNVGSDSADVGVKSLSFAGEIVVIVGPPAGELKQLFNGAQAAHFIMLGAAYRWKLHDKMLEIRYMGDEMLRLYAEGKIQSLLSEVIPFEKIREYLEKIKERHVKGKIVAKIH